MREGRTVRTPRRRLQIFPVLSLCSAHIEHDDHWLWLYDNLIVIRLSYSWIVWAKPYKTSKPTTKTVIQKTPNKNSTILLCFEFRFQWFLPAISRPITSHIIIIFVIILDVHITSFYNSPSVHQSSYQSTFEQFDSCHLAAGMWTNWKQKQIKLTVRVMIAMGLAPETNLMMIGQKSKTPVLISSNGKSADSQALKSGISPTTVP